MLYNIKDKELKTMNNCVKCAYFDNKTKICNGIGKVCFEYDKKTQTIIDTITKLPIKITKESE